MPSKQVAPQSDDLPLIGMSRFSQFRKYLPLSREKFRQLSRVGKAPQPIRMGTRLTMYENKEIHRFLTNPLGYQVE
jgi:predicted DNA-binding transcriptional regulator AlpA